MMKKLLRIQKIRIGSPILLCANHKRQTLIMVELKACDISERKVTQCMHCYLDEGISEDDVDIFSKLDLKKLIMKTINQYLDRDVFNDRFGTKRKQIDAEGDTNHEIFEGFRKLSEKILFKIEALIAKIHTQIIGEKKIEKMSYEQGNVINENILQLLFKNQYTFSQIKREQDEYQSILNGVKVEQLSQEILDSLNELKIEQIRAISDYYLPKSQGVHLIIQHIQEIFPQLSKEFLNQLLVGLTNAASIFGKMNEKGKEFVSVNEYKKLEEIYLNINMLVRDCFRLNPVDEVMERIKNSSLLEKFQILLGVTKELQGTFLVQFRNYDSETHTIVARNGESYFSKLEFLTGNPLQNEDFYSIIQMNSQVLDIIIDTRFYFQNASIVGYVEQALLSIGFCVNLLRLKIDIGDSISLGNGLRNLVETLNKCLLLRDLDLSFNQIYNVTDFDKEMVNVVNSISNMKTLSSLSLRCQSLNMKREDFQAIQKVIQECKELRAFSLDIENVPLEMTDVFNGFIELIERCSQIIKITLKFARNNMNKQKLEDIVGCIQKLNRLVDLSIIFESETFIDVAAPNIKNIIRKKMKRLISLRIFVKQIMIDELD